MNEPAAAMAWTRDQARAVEHDCARRVLDFYDAFDRGDYGAMTRMFAAEGVWHRAGKALSGADIVTELERRPA